MRWTTAGRGDATSPCSNATTVSIAKASSSSPGRSRKSGLLRPPETFVAERESFVDQNPAGCQGVCDRRQQRTVKVVGHDDPVIATAERPRRAGLEIERPYLAARSGKGRSAEMSRSTARTVKPLSMQQSRMTAAAGSQVEHQAALAGSAA